MGVLRMNRILKFRAWEESEKKMYKCIVGNNDNLDDKFICPLIWVEDRIEWVHSHTCKIMQYTGFKDIKEQEIYEGDILVKLSQWWMKKYWVKVEYKNGAFIVNSLDKNNNSEYYISDLNISEWRVIGNIYETNKGIFIL